MVRSMRFCRLFVIFFLLSLSPTNSILSNLATWGTIPLAYSNLEGGTWYKTELHHHSTFSDGIGTIPSIIATAKSLGYNAFFLTDHDAMEKERTTNVTLFDDTAISRNMPHNAWVQWGATQGRAYNDTVEIKGSIIFRHLEHAFCLEHNGEQWQTFEMPALNREYRPGENGWKNPSIVRGTIWLNFTVYPRANVGEGAGLIIRLRMSASNSTGITWTNGTYIRNIPYAQFEWDFYSVRKNITSSSQLLRAYDGIYNASGVKRIQTLAPNQWQTLCVNVTQYVEEVIDGCTCYHCTQRQLAQATLI